MTPDDSHDPQSGGTSAPHRLTLELDISGSEPLAGHVGPAGTSERIPFHGWIDLMSAIRMLRDRGADSTQS
jgi:hypothetical protein